MSYPTEVKVVGLSFRHVTEKLKQGDRVKVVPEPDNKFDPNALSIQTLEGGFLGYVGKKDPLRLRLLERANKEEVTLPVLVANYYEDGEKLWESVETGDMVQLWLRAFSKTRRGRVQKGMAGTLQTGESMATLTPDARIRRLTPLECERLMSWPDNWTIGSDTQRYKQCGNGVVSNCVQAVIEELKPCLL